jgi:hypothetical protein
MLNVKFSCSDSFSECGSIDTASPWLVNLKVFADTGVVVTASPPSVASIEMPRLAKPALSFIVCVSV